MQTMIVALTISMSTVGCCHKSCGGHASRGACYGGYSGGCGGGYYGGGYGHGYYGGGYGHGYMVASMRAAMDMVPADMRRAIPRVGRGQWALCRDSLGMPDQDRW